MYDQHATDLIKRAPIFGNINLDYLPKYFTDGYTQVVSYRLRLNSGFLAPDELKELLSEIEKIALTYESYVFLLSERENRAAAAFVAASAHQLLFRIKSLIIEQNIISLDLLRPNGVDSIICSSLLFYIAGYIADAAEMIKSLNHYPTENCEGKLINSLYKFLSGNLSGSIIQPRFPSIIEMVEYPASDALWSLIHEGVNKLIQGLTVNSESINSLFIEGQFIFNKVLDLSVDEHEIQIDGQKINFRPVFIGQKYLAKLLRIISELAPNIALINTPTPSRVIERDWRTLLSKFSKSRPYLWPNHIQAIQSGYLNNGVSAVVSFPTGGGKSTLAELKIAAALLMGKSVIFIAPTLALVAQVAKSLSKAFPRANVQLNIDEFSAIDSEIEILEDISVMTPESCLARMSYNDDSFKAVGLFVFDECHLLHSKSNSKVDRRSIDAMLCLLRIIELSPEVDVLLMSAMIKNNEEMSKWLKSIIHREVLSLSISWKPTRQVKGCVVYDAKIISDLQKRLYQLKRKNKLTANDKKTVKAKPYSYFSLNQTWHSDYLLDYKFVQLSEEEITLNVSSHGKIVPNRNHVAAMLAKDSVSIGIKTLVFVANISHTEAIASSVNSILNRESPIELTPYENNLYDLIIEEFGGEYTYFKSDALSLNHHGLLIKEERLLHESLFSRRDGVDLLVATTTLAQGMNLPAEYIIIAGNTRFDSKSDSQEPIDAHELLNAAGRAGRAGQNASGVVLVVPSEVVSFDSSEGRMAQYWDKIKSVFSQSDQCLVIEDPLGHLLDILHDQPSLDMDEVSYFMQRFPIDSDIDSTRFINRTLQAFKASEMQDQQWIESRIKTANQALEIIRKTRDEPELAWYNQISYTSGIPVEQIESLHQAFIANKSSLSSVVGTINWFLIWLCQSYTRFNYFIRMEILDSELGIHFSKKSPVEKLDFILNIFRTLLQFWLNGKPLIEIEDQLRPFRNRGGPCENARKFVNRIIPEISHAAGVLSHIYKLDDLDNPVITENYFHLKLLNQLVRMGFDSPYKLALHHSLKEETCRVHTHNIFSSIEIYIDWNIQPRDYSSLLDIVKSAHRIWQSSTEN